MEAYQERVIIEKSHLDEKIDKLNDFLHHSSPKIDNKQLALLIAQFRVMQAYSAILAERIKLFNEYIDIPFVQTNVS